MEKKALGSADELNIDSFFREQSGKSGETVAKEVGDDSKKAPEDKAVKKPEKKSKKQTDEDLDNDTDLEEENDSEDKELNGKEIKDEDSEDEDDSDVEDELDEEEDLDVKKKKKVNVAKDLEALTKKATNAETQRAQMQSERDSYKAQFEKASSSIEALNEKIENLTKITENLKKKTEQSDKPGFLTGEDTALTTEGQLKKAYEELLRLVGKSESPSEDENRPLTLKEGKRLLEEREKALSKSKTQEQPKIGSDAEAQKFWAEGQPDASDISSYYTEHKETLDPELSNLSTIEGRYLAIRNKKLEAELRTAKKTIRKAKQKLARVGKGPLPDTASGERSKPSAINDNRPTGDPLVDFLKGRRY